MIEPCIVETATLNTQSYSLFLHEFYACHASVLPPVLVFFTTTVRKIQNPCRGNVFVEKRSCRQLSGSIGAAFFYLIYQYVAPMEPFAQTEISSTNTRTRWVQYAILFVQNQTIFRTVMVFFSAARVGALHQRDISKSFYSEEHWQK